jgi:CO dehydrogenase/acetyl-CoA synthase beta subunit
MDEEAVRQHCILPLHLKRFLRQRDHEALQEHAEQLHRSEEKEREAAKAAAIADAAEKTTETTELTVKVEKKDSEQTVNTDEQDADDKMWESVDKDLGDLFSQVDPDLLELDDNAER